MEDNGSCFLICLPTTRVCVVAHILKPACGVSKCDIFGGMRCVFTLLHTFCGKIARNQISLSLISPIAAPWSQTQTLYWRTNNSRKTLIINPTTNVAIKRCATLALLYLYCLVIDRIVSSLAALTDVSWVSKFETIFQIREFRVNVHWKMQGQGGFQLEFVSIGHVINHKTCYKLSVLIGWNYSI